MKVIAKNTIREWDITGGRSYEVIKLVKSTEIGLLYQITNDAGKVGNYMATHFTDLETPIEPPSSLIDLHRRQYHHNRDRLHEDLRDLLELIGKSEEGTNIGDIRQFIEDANEYLMAMMFHANSLRIVGLTVEN